MARPRWQAGWLIKRGQKNPIWVRRYREDALTEDGSRLRRQRSVILGLAGELSQREAQQLLSVRLAAINQGRHRPEMSGSLLALTSGRTAMESIASRLVGASH